MEQHSLSWYRARLGVITGSNLSKVIKKGRKEVFGETGKTYLYQIASERYMNKSIVDNDELFTEYLDYADCSSKAMRWGTENEANARDFYALDHKGEYTVQETGLVPHIRIKHFGSSPDGICIDENGVVGAIEIKCPSNSTFMRYKTEISDAASLKVVNEDYYWQCMAHMMVLGVKWCDFIVYNPWMTDPIHVVRIVADEDAFKEAETRIALAEEYINDYILGLPTEEDNSQHEPQSHDDPFPTLNPPLNHDTQQSTNIVADCAAMLGDNTDA